jgi:hypothetical protein
MDTYAWPQDLLTLEAWDALPKPDSHRFEVMEGLLVAVPEAPAVDRTAAARLASRLDEVFRPDVAVARGIEVLVDPVYPSTIRVPDVVATRRLPADGGPAREGRDPDLFPITLDLDALLIR